MRILQEESQFSEGSQDEIRSNKLIEKRGSLPIQIGKYGSELVLSEQRHEIQSNAVVSEEVGGVSGFGSNKFEGDVV